MSPTERQDNHTPFHFILRFCVKLGGRDGRALGLTLFFPDISEVTQIIENMIILFRNTAEKIQFSVTYANI